MRQLGRLYLSTRIAAARQTEIVIRRQTPVGVYGFVPRDHANRDWIVPQMLSTEARTTITGSVRPCTRADPAWALCLEENSQVVAVLSPCFYPLSIRDLHLASMHYAT